MTTIKELREMGNEQMEALTKEARQNLFRMRVQAQTERLDAPSELKRNRRLIAQIKTIQTERTIEMKTASAETASKAVS